MVLLFQTQCHTQQHRKEINWTLMDLQETDQETQEEPEMA